MAPVWLTQRRRKYVAGSKFHFVKILLQQERRRGTLFGVSMRQEASVDGATEGRNNSKHSESVQTLCCPCVEALGVWSDGSGRANVGHRVGTMAR